SGARLSAREFRRRLCRPATSLARGETSATERRAELRAHDGTDPMRRVPRCDYSRSSRPRKTRDRVLITVLGAGGGGIGSGRRAIGSLPVAFVDNCFGDFVREIVAPAGAPGPRAF